MLALTDPLDKVCCAQLAQAFRHALGIRTVSGLLAHLPEEWIENPETNMFFSEIPSTAAGSNHVLEARFVAARVRGQQVHWDVDDLDGAQAVVELDEGHRWFGRIPAPNPQVVMRGRVTGTDISESGRLTLVNPTIAPGPDLGDPIPQVTGAVPVYPDTPGVPVADWVDAVASAVERLPDQDAEPNPAHRIGDFHRLTSQFRWWALSTHFGSARLRALRDPDLHQAFVGALRALDSQAG